ncbi:FMN-binding negative transcriptional regulator [Robiginitalea biformata]|uniref:FMN-binding negative transcriptional regulator n=1 Tax=Robiginitalea biformata TaxID=252307 RepID=UPI003B5A6431
MYIPDKYRIEDPRVIREFLEAHSFGLLVCNGPATPMATHLPLELIPGKDPLELCGHVARANPQWKHIRDGQEVLCIFQGPHSYVSSSWYREEEVPTWNYMAAHVRGVYNVQDADQLRASLDRLVDKYESDSVEPVSMEGFSPATLRQIRGIIGFTVRVTAVDVAFKLSQGRGEDLNRIIGELSQRGGLAAAVADAMKKHLLS